MISCKSYENRRGSIISSIKKEIYCFQGDYLGTTSTRKYNIVHEATTRFMVQIPMKSILSSKYVILRYVFYPIGKVKVTGSIPVGSLISKSKAFNYF